MKRLWLALPALAVAMLATSSTALGCAGLIGPNGAVNLLRTTTFAGYHDGVEHYVTSFSFEGGGAAFGSLIPLPGVPTKVERGGSWTLQRLVRETTPTAVTSARSNFLGAFAAGAEVLLTARIDALDITILRGGGPDVGRWATEHGFRLPPDAPEVLDEYAARSPIFMAAIFDADAAKQRGQRVGDGTPVHLTIPLDAPWVPLRILALGKQADAHVNADVYLLTDKRPALLPAPHANGMEIAHSAAATASLLSDLRSDKGMGWVPQNAWLTKVRIDAAASQLRYDLAIDAFGRSPSRVAAGLERPGTPTPSPDATLPSALLLTAITLASGGALLFATRASRQAA